MSERSESTEFVTDGHAQVQLDVRDTAPDGVAQRSVEMVDGEHVIERAALEEVVETFAAGGECAERVPVATEAVLAEVREIVDVGSGADQATRLEESSLVVHRQPRLPVRHRHRMTPYMRGPALTCDAGGPVMVI